MATINLLRISISLCLLILVIRSSDAKKGSKPVYMDEICGNSAFRLDGDDTPGISLQLTSSKKYKQNFSCTVKFITAQPSQRLVITVEDMQIEDCPGDTLRIYDGTSLINKDSIPQCGSIRKSFTFTSTTTQVTMTFTSNAAVESRGFQIAIALHFTSIPKCPRSNDVFLCKNKNCISNKLEKDGINHCGDRTDEN